MNSLLYLFDISFRNIRRYRLSSVIRFIGFFLCFFVMLLYMGVFFGAMKRLNTVGNIKDVSNCSMFVALTEPDIPEGYIHYSSYAFQNMIFFEDTYIDNAGLRVTDADYPDLFDKYFLEGRKISDSESECIVGNKIAKKYNIAVGDRIIIKSRTFDVCGVTADNIDSEHILINDSTVADVEYPRLYFFNDSDVPKKISGSRNLYIHDEIKAYFDMSEAGSGATREMICICLAVLLYSLVSIYSIFMFYMEKRSVAMEVCYCVGVSKKVVFLQIFLENILISGTSALCAYAFTRLLEAPLRTFNLYEFNFPLHTLYSTLAFALIISLILSTIGTKGRK